MTEIILPKRKNNRLKGYDYSTPGAYFITICTAERKNLFWKSDKDVGAATGRPYDFDCDQQVQGCCVQTIGISCLAERLL